MIFFKVKIYYIVKIIKYLTLTANCTKFLKYKILKCYCLFAKISKIFKKDKNGKFTYNRSWWS